MLYHIVKKDFADKVLYPLSILKKRNLQAYTEHAKKYIGREHVTELFIPQLHCRWNDVIHLSAVHPNEIVAKLKETGFKITRPYLYYEIDQKKLNPRHTVVYPNTPRKDPRTVTEEEFVAFDPNDIKRWSTIPETTVKYYQTKFAKGERPLLFVFVPHVLYKGTIDVSDLTLKKTH